MTWHFMKALVYGGIVVDSAHFSKALIAVVLTIVAIMCPFIVRNIWSFFVPGSSNMEGFTEVIAQYDLLW